MRFGSDGCDNCHFWEKIEVLLAASHNWYNGEVANPIQTRVCKNAERILERVEAWVPISIIKIQWRELWAETRWDAFCSSWQHKDSPSFRSLITHDITQNIPDCFDWGMLPNVEYIEWRQTVRFGNKAITEAIDFAPPVLITILWVEYEYVGIYTHDNKQWIRGPRNWYEYRANSRVNIEI
jgi:hypothetical protein